MSLIKKRRESGNQGLSNFAFPSMFPNMINDSLLGRDFFDLGFGNTVFPGNTLPAVNIMETKDNFMIEVAAPGMKRDDFKITLDNNMLIISSETEENSEEKDEDYTRKEFYYSSFQRSFTLPQSVIADKISAKYSDGILNITVPKTEEAKKKVKEIQITA